MIRQPQELECKAPLPACYRATARDVIIHRNQYKIHFRMASKTRGTNVRHTRATVTALLEFLYKWMPLHSLGLYYRYGSL